MTSPLYPSLIRLRLLVAFLGERKQFNWWDTSFLDQTGRRFLERPFPRTAEQAALRSASEAAARAHDAAIGKRGAFHLFRLQVEQEEFLDVRIGEMDPLVVADLTASTEVALTALSGMAESGVSASRGPVQVGLEKQLGSPAVTATLAAYYAAAFRDRAPSFPYFVKA